MSIKCRKKKEIINKKRKENEDITYSELTPRRITRAPEPQIKSTLDNNTHEKLFICMFHAHFRNAEIPGIYE